jgi:hypothetical protein
MPSSELSGGQPPLSRREALEFWSRAVGYLSLAATGAIALGAAFQDISGGMDLEYTLLGLGLVTALPVLWIALARFAERRYLTRPPARYIAAALGFDVSGIALVAGAVVLLQAETSAAAPVFAAGGVLEGCGTLLLLLWFLATRLVAPSSDHMHAL